MRVYLSTLHETEASIYMLLVCSISNRNKTETGTNFFGYNCQHPQ